MSDYISREEPIDKIIDEVEKEFEKVNIPLVDKLTIFAKVQNALYKCADVRENVHGEWFVRSAPIGGVEVCECSLCHKCYIRLKSNYCPNCGAKMDK